MNNRFLRPVCMVLTVLYALSGVYIVMKRVLVALVDRFAAESAVLFVQGSSVVEFVLFTVCIGIGLLCLAFFTRGRLRAAFFLLMSAQVVVILGNLLSRLAPVGAMTASLCAMLLCACCTFIGYALLAHAGRPDLRGIGWISAALASVNQLCSSLSILSAILMNTGTFALWFTLFTHTALASSVLSIIANIVQALCFLLLFFSFQRTDDTKDSLPANGQINKEVPDENLSTGNHTDGDSHTAS